MKDECRSWRYPWMQLVCSWSTVVLGPSYCGTNGSQGYSSQKSLFGPPRTCARLLFLAPDGVIIQNFLCWPLCHILSDIPVTPCCSYFLSLSLPLPSHYVFPSGLLVLELSSPPLINLSALTGATRALLLERHPEPLSKACHACPSLCVHAFIQGSAFLPVTPENRMLHL